MYFHQNQNRNTFYTPWNVKNGTPAGDFTPTGLQSVFNISPLENKLFKTIDLQGDSPWAVTLQTDIQASGFISVNWFEKKEGTYFAFVRNNTVGELKLRSVNGIGRSSQVVGGNVIRFPLTISIGSIISIGDLFYFLLPPNFTGSPILAGQVTAITVDLPNGVNQITINTAISGTTPISVQDAYFLYIKNFGTKSYAYVFAK